MPQKAKAGVSPMCTQCKTQKLSSGDLFCYQCGLKHDKRGGESDSDDENESGASGAGPAATSLASDPAVSRSVVGVPKIKFEGWLTKRGKRNKRSWRMRWFVLYAGSPAGTLCYYTAEDRKRQKGSITLEDSSFNPIDPNGDGQFGFNIVTGKRLWEIFAGKEEYRTRWLRVLETAAVSKSSALMDEAEAMMEAHFTLTPDKPPSTPFSPWGGAVDFTSVKRMTPPRSAARKVTTPQRRRKNAEPVAEEGIFTMNFAASESESNTEEDLSEDEGPSVPGWVSERGAHLKTHGTRRSTGTPAVPPARQETRRANSRSPRKHSPTGAANPVPSSSLPTRTPRR